MFKRKYKTRQNKDLENKEEITKDVITQEPSETVSDDNSSNKQLPELPSSYKPKSPSYPRKLNHIKKKTPKSLFNLNIFNCKQKVEANNIKDENKTNKYNSIEKQNTSNDNILTDILNNDEKLLFSLNAIGSIQKDEKLTEKDNLLTVDDRWLFQGVRRWWSEDSRKKSSNKTLIIISTVTERINTLLEEDYLDKIKEENKTKPKYDKLETPDEKKFKENRDKRRRLINKYFISLNKAKTGIENSRDTYFDNFTKNIFNLSIQKVDDILEKLK